MKLDFSRQIFKKSSNIQFHQNPSSGSRVVPCRQTDGWTDMTKRIVAFRNSANAPKSIVCKKMLLGCGLGNITQMLCIAVAQFVLDP
jgi:hypothetical protein